MRKFFIIPAFFVSSLIGSAQPSPDYTSIKLEAKEDYTADVDKAALQAARLLLSTPGNDRDVSRLAAAQFLIRWMSGTPTYTFTLDERAGKFAKDDLLIVYMAAMVKYSLEHPADSKMEKVVQLNAVKGLLDYCRQFEVKMTGELKRLNAANEKGELEKYLGK
ncbi:MAG TPA: hypothetical protein VGE66_04650 [Chitinophagaceae bacterium]